MKLPCSFCRIKTDELKLRTIDTREYLLCANCDRWSHDYGDSSNGEDNEESGATEFIKSIKTT